MPDDNRVSAVVSDTDKQSVLTKLSEIRALLPFLLNIPEEEKRGIVTISTERGAMDQTYSNQMAAHPELVPSYVDTAELAKDRVLRATLMELLTAVKELAEALGDTIHAVGSDIYLAYLAYYSNVKMAAKRNVAGADALLDELEVFFARGPRTEPAPVPAGV